MDPAPAAPAPEEDKATGPVPHAQEEDPGPAASTPEDAWKIIQPCRCAKRKQGSSTSSPTKPSKKASAPSTPPKPGKQL